MSDHDQPVAANLLARQFTADGPNRRWVGDTTEFVIAENEKLYLAAILDLFSRFIVGWAVSAVNDRHLTLKALDLALKRRCPETGLLHHSDQGCTYASEDSTDAGCQPDHVLDEPTRQLSRQRGHGFVLLLSED
jgi:putative transposase